MLIKTKNIVCATREIFNTFKLPSGPSDTNADILWSSTVYIENTAEIWSHGKLFGGLFSNADENKVSLSIGGVTKILSLHGHTQPYTTLTGSTEVANQAILSSGTANGWMLKTLGKNAFSNVDYLPADATAVAAEKVVNPFVFSVKSNPISEFDGSSRQEVNLVEGDNVYFTTDAGNVTISAEKGEDTVNTAGALNKVDTKMFLIGAQTQTAAPQTYSNQYVYIGSNNRLYSGGKEVLTDHQPIYNLDLQTQIDGTVTKVITFDPNSANNSFTLVQGTNVTLTPDITNKKVTISSKDTTYNFYDLIFKQGTTVVDTYKPTTSPNKSLKAGTNVTFSKNENEITITSQDTKTTTGATEKLATKLFLTGSLAQTDNPQTYTNSKVYVGTDNKLYSDGKVVSTGDHTHNYAGATTPGGPALQIALNPSGLSNATYGTYGGILQGTTDVPISGSWFNRVKILHDNSTGYYTELAQSFTGTAGLWHRRNVAGKVSEWVPVLDKDNFGTYLGGAYVKKSGDTMTGPLIVQDGVRLVIDNSKVGYLQLGKEVKKGVISSFNGDTLTSLDIRCDKDSVTINSNKIWHAGNDGVGSGLDADLLDGWHLDAIRRRVWSFENYAKNSENEYNPNDIIYGGMMYNYENMTNWLNMPSGFSYGSVIRFCPYQKPLLNGMFAWDINHNSTTDVTRKLYFRSNGNVNNVNTWGKWHEVVFTDGNVNSATKLQTSRNLWGRPFDGTANVSGNMTGVGSITMSGSIVMNNSQKITGKHTDGTNMELFHTNTSNSLVIGTGNALKGGCYIYLW